MTTERRQTKRRFGLGFRINSVISILLMILVAIAAFSYRSLSEFSDQINVFSKRTLPALSNSINLTASLEEIVQNTETLMNSNIQASRRIAYDDTITSLEVIKSSITAGSNFAEAEELTTVLDILSGTTNELNTLIEQKIALSLQVDNLHAAFNAWAVDNLAVPETAEDSGIDIAYLRWLDQTRGLILKAASLSSRSSARDQRRMTADVTRQARQLSREIEQLPEQSRFTAQYQLDALMNRLTNDDGFFETLKTLGSIDVRSQALARQMRVLVAELLRKTEALAFTNSQQAQTATDLLNAKVERQLTFLLTSVLFAITVAVLSYLFIERQVMRRLSLLRNAVLDRAAGGNRAVPADGKDEVTDIGQAVQFFINEIDGRQKKLQDSAQQLQSVIELSPQSMCITTKKQILYYNETFVSVWEAVNPGLVFDPCTAHARIPDAIYKNTEKGLVTSLSRYAIKGSDSIVHWFDLTSSVVEWQGELAHQLIAVDVTKQVQVEHTLEEARRRAEAAAQSKTNFLAMMSHEIRSPMNGIISVGEILERGTLDTEQRQLVQVINQSAETLLTILNDILDLSKIEAGKLEITKADFELPQMILGVTNLLATSFKQKSIVLTINIAPDVPEWVHGDANRIRQILFNLLGNALKFTEHGSVSLDVTASASANPRRPFIHIAIKDTGVGISEDAVERLFQPFEQADSTTARRFGGTGLGLSICKRLADLMQGNITVKSTPDVGSEFILRLPLRTLTTDSQHTDIAEDTPHAMPFTQDITKPRILVVEDNKVNQLVIGKILKSLGYEWDTADDGLNALELYDPKSHGLILTDLRMPRMDGFALARAIRADEKNNDRIPIVALSADAMDEAKKLSKQSGIDAFLTKPVKVEDVRECLGRF